MKIKRISALVLSVLMITLAALPTFSAFAKEDMFKDMPELDMRDGKTDGGDGKVDDNGKLDTDKNGDMGDMGDMFGDAERDLEDSYRRDSDVEQREGMLDRRDTDTDKNDTTGKNNTVTDTRPEKTFSYAGIIIAAVAALAVIILVAVMIPTVKKRD